MQAWLQAGLAPGTVKLRRAALRHLWHTLDGRDAANPVRGSMVPTVPRLEARALRYADIMRIFEVMPRSKAKARLRVIAWTGLPHALIAQIEPAHIHWDNHQLRTTPRGKGRGAPAVILPLLEQAVTALHEFDQLGAYGAFSREPVRKALKRGCRKVGINGVRPYDLRHSFGTLIYEATGDLGVASHLLMHSGLQTTTRYTLGAVSKVALDAINKASHLLKRQL